MRTLRSPLFPWLIAAVGFFSLLAAVSPGRITASDVGSRLLVARQLWSQGDVFLPGDHSLEGLIYLPQKNASTSLYGIGQSLVLAPFDLLGCALTRVFPVPASLRKDAELLPILFGLIPFIGTLLWLVMALVLCELGACPSQALALTLLFSGSTILWFYSGQSTQEESLVALFLTSAFLMALKWRKSKSSFLAFATGALCACAMTVRLNSVFGILPIAGVLVDDLLTQNASARSHVWQGALWALLGSMPPLLVLGAFAYWRFGNVLSTGYDIAREREMGVFWGPFNFAEMIRLVFGPGKGLLVLSPPILIALWGFKSWFRSQRYASLGAVFALVLSLWVCSKILNNPEGSESWGARYQVHLLALWIVPFSMGWKKAWNSGWRPVALGLVALGIAIQFLSAFAPTSLEYLQVRGDRILREEITASFTQGQLPLRARNLWTWARGRSAAAEVQEGYRESFAYIERTYVPNFWGPVYSKRLGNPLPLFASLFLVTMSLLALAWVTARPQRATAPTKSSP